jgi:archaellum component FlaC
MATKKITLNEFRSLIKRFVAEGVDTVEEQINDFKLLISRYEELNPQIHKLRIDIGNVYKTISDDDDRIKELKNKLDELSTIREKITRYPLGFIDKKDIKDIREYNELLRLQKMYSYKTKDDSNYMM